MGVPTFRIGAKMFVCNGLGDSVPIIGHAVIDHLYKNYVKPLDIMSIEKLNRCSITTYKSAFIDK